MWADARAQRRKLLDLFVQVAKTVAPTPMYSPRRPGMNEASASEDARPNHKC